MVPDPKTLQQAILIFSDPEQAHAYAVAQRWPDGVTCPKCGSKNVLFLAKYNRWKCREKHASPQFTLKTGTIMEESPIAIGKWLIAMWMLANCKNGISSYEIAKAIGVSQHSCWFMLHRIREAMKEQHPAHTMGSPDGGEVEGDETWVGPNVKRMQAKRKLKLQKQRNEYTNSDPDRPMYLCKTPVQGLLDREKGRVHARVVRNTTRVALQEAILHHVAPGSRLYTDEMPSYRWLAKDYVHQFVNHLERYVDGRVHTNGLENFWSLLKRTLRGSYVAVEPFHLGAYVDEQVFRFNNRGRKDNRLNDADRMALVASQVAGTRLTYKKLTGKEG